MQEVLDQQSALMEQAGNEQTRTEYTITPEERVNYQRSKVGGNNVKLYSTQYESPVNIKNIENWTKEEMQTAMLAVQDFRLSKATAAVPSLAASAPAASAPVPRDFGIGNRLRGFVRLKKERKVESQNSQLSNQSMLTGQTQITFADTFEQQVN